MNETIAANKYSFPQPALSDAGVTLALEERVDVAKANADIAAGNVWGTPVVVLPSAVIGRETARLCLQASMMTRF